MEINDERIIAILQELTQFINDGRAGYEQAAKESVNPQLGPFYRTLAGQRAEFAEELNQIIKNHGGETETNSPAPGTLYQQWLDAKATLAGQDEESILDASITGEEWAQKAYADALQQSDLPQPTRQLLEQQQQASEQAHQALQELKNKR